MFKRILPLLLAAVLLSSCAAETLSPEVETILPTEIPAPSQSVETEFVTEPSAEPLDPVDQILSEMTLREKVGQLFIIRPDSLELTQTQDQRSDPNAAGVTGLTDAMAAALQDYPVGGIVMFAKNIESPDQITSFNAALQSAVDIPLFICVDEEGGLVARLANHNAFDLPKYKNAASVGAGGDPSRALEMGRTIGAYLRKYGFNINFAPVADVNTNPNNPVIGSRAFSSDPKIAGQMTAAMAEGLRENAVIPTFKHFPGHGDTAEDSHYGLAVSNKTEEELAACEWLPFEAAGSGDLVMVSHIALPNVLDNSTPATMSREIVTDILRGELGFQGLVITDSLEMEAITDQYDSGEAALGALRAGCDLLLMPADFTSAFDAVVEAVETGDFSEAQLDAVVAHILRFKAQHGLLGVG